MPGAIFDEGRHGKSKCALIAIFYPSCDENTFLDSIDKIWKLSYGKVRLVSRPSFSFSVKNSPVTFNSGARSARNLQEGALNLESRQILAKTYSVTRCIRLPFNLILKNYCWSVQFQAKFALVCLDFPIFFMWTLNEQNFPLLLDTPH